MEEAEVLYSDKEADSLSDCKSIVLTPVGTKKSNTLPTRFLML
jgi:hypothetical protein